MSESAAFPMKFRIPAPHGRATSFRVTPESNVLKACPELGAASVPQKPICQPGIASELANWYGAKLRCGLPAAPWSFVDHDCFGAASWTFDDCDLALLVMRPCRTVVVHDDDGSMAMRTVNPVGDDNAVGGYGTVMRAEGCT